MDAIVFLSNLYGSAVAETLFGCEESLDYRECCECGGRGWRMVAIGKVRDGGI